MAGLAHLQRLFWQAVTSEEVSEAALQGTVLPCGTLSAAQRVQIYATMGAQRGVEALAADFPNLARALGASDFRRVALRYLALHPSEHPSIAFLGRSLAEHLRSSAQSLPRPDLADLAALEWARSRVFEAAPGHPVDAYILTTLSEAALPRARFQFVPALQCFPLAFDIAPLWRALEHSDAEGADATLPAPKRGPITVAVWRPEFDVLHTVLEPEAADGLQRAQAGAPLEEVCEAFAALPHPVQAAFGAIGAWFADGWVAALA